MEHRRLGKSTSRRVFLRRVGSIAGAVALTPLLQACGSSAAPAAATNPPAPASAATSVSAKPATSPAPAASPSGVASPGAAPSPGITVSPSAAASVASPSPASSPAVVAPAADATGADLTAARQEGKLVWYTPTALGTKLLEAFTQKYPFIDTSGFLLLQAGDLYNKITSEMQANVQSADVYTTSEVANAIDFQSKGWYMQYASPQAAVFDKKWQSDPVGYWVTANVELAGIGWSPNNLPDANAPQTWTDLLDPKWAGQLMTKQSNSGQQYELYAMITAMHGDSYWDQFAAQKPHPVNANAGLFDALLNGQYLINACCQQSTYSTMKRDGAPLSMAFPKDGVGQIMSVSGVVHNAPHPNAAKLFLDWLCSPDGAQTISQVTLAPSTRPGAAPPQFMPPLETLNIWTPPDLKAYVAGQPAWVDKWNKIIGAS